MLRKTGKTTDYVPVKRINNKRYIINFDLQEVEGNEGYAIWSQHGYYKKPTTEEVKADVVRFTQQRYESEGLEVPKAEDVDVSEYVIV